jgi:1,2-diacylglycerol 3-beta-galactosyltransferase
MNKRILFLMSDTGGGHRASANAISQALHHLYPDQYETHIEDIWIDRTYWPINRLPNAYPWLSDSGVRWWGLLWRATGRRPVRFSLFTTADLLVTRPMLRFLRAMRPDLVVSVHPGMNHMGLRWVRRCGLDVPFVTVVTDMVTVHPLWICPKVTACMVSTEPARRQALALGMPAEKIRLFGQPVSLQFAQMDQSKAALRQKLGLDIADEAGERPCVLIAGGGEGIGRIYDIARAVAARAPHAQLAIIAGRNAALKARLEAVDWEIPTRVNGFVDNMPEWMGAADILISKAGPGMISEAFIAGLPLILSGYIPGQETGNVHYVLDNKAGAYAADPVEIAERVNAWTRPGNSALAEMMRNAERLARPNASLDIARELRCLVEDREEQRAHKGRRNTLRDF